MRENMIVTLGCFSQGMIILLTIINLLQNVKRKIQSRDFQSEIFFSTKHASWIL
jgi:hypothetical protein